MKGAVFKTLLTIYLLFFIIYGSTFLGDSEVRKEAQQNGKGNFDSNFVI